MGNHRVARMKRDRLKEANPEVSERFEREYVRLVSEGASPFDASHIASMSALEGTATEVAEGGGIDVPDSTLQDISQERRAWREQAGLPPERDANDVSDSEDLPTIEELSEAS